MAVNTRLVYFLIFLVIVLPVIVGILVWQLLPGCDNDNNQSSIGNTKPYKNGVTTSQNAHEVPEPTDSPFEDGPWKNLRLSKYVLPEHYMVTLYPDFYGSHAWFYGNVTIELHVLKESRYLMVHVHYLNISSTTLHDHLQNNLRIKRTFEYKPNQFLVIEPEPPIRVNTTLYLTIGFAGSLSRAIVGLYKSTYVDSLSNQKRSITTSKFEPVAARRAFPCMDEPNMKAHYTVSLVHRQNYTVLSNMPVNVTQQWRGDSMLQVTQFDTSVKMSTYLVCFIVCDFVYLENISKHNITVRLYAPVDRINQTRYALEVAVTVVDLYTDMFQVPYPLPKLDLISIPDFVSGAMEHWGLITFRETNLLYDPVQSSSYNKQRVATVISHEIAHQISNERNYLTMSVKGQKLFTFIMDKRWFGNLVTMDWWQDLWLNEGFASFMEYIGAAQHEPDWDIPGQFLIDDLQPVMVTDAGLSSHPIVVDVQDPSQINAVFDSISYSKGASVIRMLENWMGKEKFFSGISKYLKKYKYQNAQTDDLWIELGDISAGLSVKTVMDTWTKQMGMPYINIEVDISGTNITATQHRFLADSSFTFNESSSPYHYTWYLKLDFMTSNGTEGNHWLKQVKSVSFTVPDNLQQGNAWIKFNVNETGFYRVNYPTFLWQQFSKELSKGGSMKLRVADKANLIDDAFNLARANVINYGIALNLTIYIDKENDYLPWKSALNGFSYISDMLEFTPDYGDLRKYVLIKVSKVLDKLKWSDNGTHLKRRLRASLLSLACHNGHRESLDKVAEKFRAWIDNSTQISPNLRSLVYTYGIMLSDSPGDWDIMWDRYMVEPVAQEKVKLMRALAQTRTVWLLMKYIDYAKDETKVRSQDFFNVLAYIANNPVGRDLIWNWSRDNWQYMIDRFTLYSRYFGRLIPSIVSNFNTKKQLNEVEMFFATYPDAGAGKNGRQQTLESINRNINWMETHKPVVVTWLRQHV